MKYVRGFTLLEVLVTVVVVSIGFLGIAMMQVTGVRSTNASVYRLQASMKLDDITERIRNNPTAVINNHFMSINAPSGVSCDAAPDQYCEEYSQDPTKSMGPSPIVAAESCSPEELAQFDIVTWFCGVQSYDGLTGGVTTILPNASATIACVDSTTSDNDDCTNDSPHTITINWDELDPSLSDTEAVSRSVSATIYL